MVKGVLVTLYPPTINFHFDVGFHNNQNIKLWEAKVQIILLTHKFFVKKNIHFLSFISPQLCPLSITFKFSETDADCWQILATQPYAPNATRDGQAPIKLKKQWDMKVG